MAQLNVVPNQVLHNPVTGAPTTTPTPGVQGRLNLMPEDRLPKSMLGPIFEKVQEESLLLTKGRQVKVGINETIVSTGDTFPEAGQIGNGTLLEDREGAIKPVAGLQYGGSRAFRPIKLGVIVTLSQEYVNENPSGIYTALATKLPQAITRAVDAAVFFGRDTLRSSMLLGVTDNGYINQTSKRVTLDFSQGADVVDQLITGYDLLTGDDEWDLDSYIAAPSIRSRIVTRRDADGNPIFVPGAFPGSGAEINVNAGVGALLGTPVEFNKRINGKIGNAPKTDVVMMGGQWDQLVWGFADQITFKVSTEATLSDGDGGVISLWQTNQVAVLCEATFGWLVNDPDAFIAYEWAQGSSS